MQALTPISYSEFKLKSDSILKAIYKDQSLWQNSEVAKLMVISKKNYRNHKTIKKSISKLLKDHSDSPDRADFISCYRLINAGLGNKNSRLFKLLKTLYKKQFNINNFNAIYDAAEQAILKLGINLLHYVQKSGYKVSFKILQPDGSDSYHLPFNSLISHFTKLFWLTTMNNFQGLEEFNILCNIRSEYLNSSKITFLPYYDAFRSSITIIEFADILERLSYYSLFRMLVKYFCNFDTTTVSIKISDTTVLEDPDYQTLDAIANSTSLKSKLYASSAVKVPAYKINNIKPKTIRLVSYL